MESRGRGREEKDGGEEKEEDRNNYLVYAKNFFFFGNQFDLIVSYGSTVLNYLIFETPCSSEVYDENDTILRC